MMHLHLTQGANMSQFVPSKYVLERYDISRSSLYRWQEDPSVSFPRPSKIGAKLYWRQSDLDAFDNRVASKKNGGKK